MLHLKHSPHIELPHLSLSGTGGPMQLSPVPADDNDELTQAIENQAVENDDNWELNERPDAEQLTQFWTTVVDDVAKDPEWFNFSED